MDRKPGTLYILGDRFHFRKIIFSKSASHFDLLNPEQFSTIIKNSVWSSTEGKFNCQTGELLEFYLSKLKTAGGKSSRSYLKKRESEQIHSKKFNPLLKSNRI
jgi:hypothetical protein